NRYVLTALHFHQECRIQTHPLQHLLLRSKGQSHLPPLQQTTQYLLFLLPLIQQILNLLKASESLRKLIEISKNKFRSFSFFYTISFPYILFIFWLGKAIHLFIYFVLSYK